MGAPDQVIQTTQAKLQQQNQEFEVYAEGWQAFRVFTSLASQWRVIAGLGGVTWQGIDRSALLATLQMNGIKPELHQELLHDIELMERAAAEQLNKRNP